MLFCFNENLYIPVGILKEGSIQEFENSEHHKAVSLMQERNKLLEQSMLHHSKYLKYFTHDETEYCYISILKNYLRNIEMANRFQIYDSHLDNWYLIEDILNQENVTNNDNDGILNDGFEKVLSGENKENVSFYCEDIIEKVFSDYGCIFDNIYKNVITIDSRYYDINTKYLDWPKSVNNKIEYSDIIKFIDDQVKIIDLARNNTMLYFTFFDGLNEYALYCEKLIDDVTEYTEMIDYVSECIKRKGGEFIQFRTFVFGVEDI